jgi:hypothetical protein
VIRRLKVLLGSVAVPVETRAVGSRMAHQSSALDDFQTLSSVKIDPLKTIKNYYKHVIDRVVVIVRIYHFLYSELYGHIYFSPHIISQSSDFFSHPNSLHGQVLRKN